MKRGVPPTARKARTGELTPPGMTCWARSNSCVRCGRLAQWTWRGLLAAGRRRRLRRPASSPRLPRRAAGPRRSGPGSRCPCRGGSPRPAPGRGRSAPRRRRRAVRRPTASSAASAADSVSPAPTKATSKRSNFSPVIAPCGEASTLSRNWSAPQCWAQHAGDQHVARAVLGRGHRQLARRGRALAVPVGQQEVGQRLVVAHQHLGLRQHQFAEGVEVGLLVVFLDPRQVGHVGDQRHVGVVGQRSRRPR